MSFNLGYLISSFRPRVLIAIQMTVLYSTLHLRCSALHLLHSKVLFRQGFLAGLGFSIGKNLALFSFSISSFSFRLGFNEVFLFYNILCSLSLCLYFFPRDVDQKLMYSLLSAGDHFYTIISVLIDSTLRAFTSHSPFFF